MPCREGSHQVSVTLGSLQPTSQDITQCQKRWLWELGLLSPSLRSHNIYD